MLLAQVQKALFSALNGNISAPVYENTGQGLPFPYVTIGDNQFDDFSTDDSSGAEVTINVHTWSRDNSIGETLELQDEITQLLNLSYLQLDSWDNAGVSFQFSTVIKDPDGITKHGVLRFNAYIGERQ